MKFGQLIEYNMRNFILEKSYSKYGGGNSPIKIKHISGSKSKVLYNLFLLYPKLRAVEIY